MASARGVRLSNFIVIGAAKAGNGALLVPGGAPGGLHEPVKETNSEDVALAHGPSRS